MAIFDVLEQRICIRIVYDGVAGAGKTTNVRMLSSLFAAQRTRDLFSPVEIDGRTLFFDWMQIHGGAISGFPLLCQVISVPGQVVLTERRRHLLETADVVVYVCNSSASVQSSAVEGLAVLDEVIRSRAEPPVVVVQANQQDQPDAVSGAELLERIGTRDLACVEAIARDGIGVVDTFVAAVRAMSQRLQVRAEREVVRLPVDRAEQPEALLAALESVDVDPQWAAEMCLEEINRAFLAEELARGPSPEAAPVAAEGFVPIPRPDVPPGHVWPAHTGRTRLRALVDASDSSRAAPLDEQGVAAVNVPGFRAVTSVTDRYHDTEHARQALVRAARELTQLGPLLSPETVIVLQPTSTDESWLWTIHPTLPSARAWLAEDISPSERERRANVFASAVSEARSYADTHGVALDLAPDSFGVEDGCLRYVGKRVVDAAFAENADAGSRLRPQRRTTEHSLDG